MTHEAFCQPLTLGTATVQQRLERPLSRCRRRRVLHITPTTPTAVIEQLNKLSIQFDAQSPAAAGSFGEVFFGTLTKTNEPVVLKRPRKDSTARALFRHERAINKKIDLPDPTHWPKFLGDHTHHSQSFLVWRRIGDGQTLDDYLFARPPSALASAVRVPNSTAELNVPLFTCVVGQLLSALKDLHERGVVHRDVKPSNILVAPGAAKPLRLIDFGSSADVSNPFWSRGINTLDPLFAAPEQRLSLLAPDKFDVFSVAMISIAVLIPAFASESRLREFRMRLEQADFDLRQYRDEITRLGGGGDLAPLFDPSDGAAKEVFSLLCAMFKRNPISRKSVNNALQDLGFR